MPHRPQGSVPGPHLLIYTFYLPNTFLTLTGYQHCSKHFLVIINSLNLHILIRYDV